MLDLSELMALLQREHSYFLISHINPDGDSIGSLLAMGEALRAAGKKVSGLCSPGPVPAKYRFLTGSDEISSQICYDGAAVVLLLDCGDLGRIGHFREQIAGARILINIDHHVTNERFGTLNYVDEKAAATGEIIFEIISALGVPLTRSMAEALYVAIATDTGSFKYDNTTAKTHRVIAAILEQHQLNTAVLSRRVFDERPLSFYLLLKEAISTLEMEEGGRLASLTISRDLLEKCGTTVEEIEGLVNYTRKIEGVELGILFYVESATEVKVGFRSQNVDVSLMAGRLGGGGHARAAGCRLSGSFPELKEQVLREACRLLDGDNTV